MLFVNNSRLTVTVTPPYINIADTITPCVQAHNFILKNLPYKSNIAYRNGSHPRVM